MSAYKAKSWQEKLNIDRKPEIEKVTKAFAGVKLGERLLIPTPKVVDAYIRQIPEGKQVAVQTLKNDLAMEYGADVTCPLTTGIFLRIVAEAAYEEYCKGKTASEITPFWRIIDEKSTTAKKFSFGTDFLAAQRKMEGLSPV